MTDISFEEVLSQHKMKTGALLLSYSVTLGQSDKVTYSYYEMEEEKTPKKVASKTEDKTEDEPKENPNIILKASNSPYFVKVDRSKIMRLIKLDKKTLIKINKEEKVSVSATNENKKKM